MTHTIKDPVLELNKAVPPITSRFDFERNMSIVGRSDFTDISLPNQTKDVDIYDGTIVTTHCYFRLARHKNSGTICLIASKASANLQGIRKEEGGIIEPTRTGLQKSYIVSAYRNSGDDNEVYQVSKHFRRDLRRFGEDLGERSEKHFTLYGVSVSNLDKNSTDFDADTPTEIYTNGRLAYVLDKTAKGYQVVYHAPTRREDGGFVPVQMGDKSLSDKFSSVSKTIATTDSYDKARQKLAEHWQMMSSKLWDHKSIYKSEGVVFNAKVVGAKVYNHVMDEGEELVTVSGVTGLLMGVFNPKYGIASGLAASFVHTAMHLAIEGGYRETSSAMKKARDARKRLDISAYDYGQDASDHFKIQTAENIKKLCSKIDMDRFEASEFEFLDAKTSGMLLDHQNTSDGFRPSSIRAHILSAHQRGFSSTCTLPDERTRLDVFQSGLTRLMHEEPDGNIVMYCRYRPDVTIADNLRLPEDKIFRMGENIIRLDYDRRRDTFYHAFKQFPKPVSLDEMMSHMEKLMLHDGHDKSDVIKSRSLQSIRDTFYLPEQDECAESYMSRKPAVPPELSTIMGSPKPSQ